MVFLFSPCWGILNALLRAWEGGFLEVFVWRGRESFKIAQYRALLQHEDLSVFPCSQHVHFVCDIPLKAFLNSVFPNLIKSPDCLCCLQKCRMKWKLDALKMYVPGESSCKQMPNSVAKQSSSAGGCEDHAWCWTQ